MNKIINMSRRKPVTIERYVAIFEELNKQQTKNGFVEPPQKISKQFGGSAALKSELTNLGFIEYNDAGYYVFYSKNLTPEEATAVLLNERTKKDAKNRKRNEKEKKLSTLKQQTIDFKKDEKIDKIVKSKRVQKQTVEKFYKLIWDLLRERGKFIDLKDVNEVRKHYKFKYKVIDALLYAGVLEEVENRYLVASNFYGTMIDEWSEKSAGYYSAFASSKLKKNKEVEVVQVVEDKNEVVDPPKNERQPTEKKIRELEEYSEERINSKFNSNGSGEAYKFFRNVTVNSNNLFLDKQDLIHFISGLSPEEYKFFMGDGPLIDIIDIIDLIRYICDINEQKVDILINHITLKNELQK